MSRRWITLLLSMHVLGATACSDDSQQTADAQASDSRPAVDQTVFDQATADSEVEPPSYTVALGYDLAIELSTEGAIDYQITSVPVLGEVYFFDAAAGLLVYLPKQTGTERLIVAAQTATDVIASEILIVVTPGSFDGTWELTDGASWEMHSVYTEDKLNDPEVQVACNPATLSVTQTETSLDVAKPEFECPGNPLLDLLEQPYSTTVQGEDLVSNNCAGAMASSLDIGCGVAMAQWGFRLTPVVGSRGDFHYTAFHTSLFRSAHRTQLTALAYQPSQRTMNKAVVSFGQSVGGSCAVGVGCEIHPVIQNFGDRTASFAFSPQLSQLEGLAPDEGQWTIDFKGGAFPGEGSDCGPTLDPDTSCTLVLSTSSQAAGDARARLLLPVRDENGIGVFELQVRALFQ